MLVWVEYEAEPSRRLRELVELLKAKLEAFLVERFRCASPEDCRAIIEVEGPRKAYLWVEMPYDVAGYRLRLRRKTLEVSGYYGRRMFSLEGGLESVVEDAILYMIPHVEPIEPVDVEGW